MAAKPSPAALRARRDLEKEQAAHGKTRDRLKTSEAAVKELQHELAEATKNVNRDTNGSAAAAAEIATVRNFLDRSEQEVTYLRQTLSRITLGGVHIRHVDRV